MSSNKFFIRWAFNCRTWAPTLEEWDFATSCVQPDELIAVFNFFFKDDCKRAIISRLLMRKAAAELSGIPYDKIKFSRNELGKPTVCNYPEVFRKLHFSFNVSHHGDYCVIAAENGSEVGIDVMNVDYKGDKSVPDYLHLMKRNFSLSDFRYMIEDESEEIQIKRFIRLWCLKESFLKAIGTGISFNLQKVSFEINSDLTPDDDVNDTVVLVNGQPLKEWTFEETYLSENYVTSVALLKPASSAKPDKAIIPHFEVISFKNLMEDAVSVHNPKSYWWTFQSKENKP